MATKRKLGLVVKKDKLEVPSKTSRKYKAEPKIILSILFTILITAASLISYAMLTSYYGNNLSLALIYFILPFIIIWPVCVFLGVDLKRPKEKLDVLLKTFIATIFTFLIIAVGIFGAGISVNAPAYLMPITFIYVPFSLIILWVLCFAFILKPPKRRASFLLLLAGVILLIGAIAIIYIANVTF